MTPPQIQFHLLQYCQILVVSSTPATIGMMRHLATMQPPDNQKPGAKGDGTPFKIILCGFDPTVVDLVRQARQSQHPVSLVIVDIQKRNDWDVEQMITRLLGLDAALHILLLMPGDAALGTRLVSFLSRSNRMAMLKTPCDELELGQFVRVILAKWLSERQNAGLSAGSQPDLTDALDLPQLQSGPQQPGAAFNKPSTVLVVEDDETVLWMMSKVLETHQYHVLVARDAEDGWKKWRENINIIKLVITDINMPGGPNGVALGHAIQDEDGSVPVIYTSGHRAVHEFAELRSGTNYLVKPFRMDELLGIIQRALAVQESRGLCPQSRLVTWAGRDDSNLVESAPAMKA